MRVEIARLHRRLGQHPALWWEDKEKAEKIAAFLRTRTAETGTGEDGAGKSNTLLMALAGAAALMVLFMVFRRRRS